MFLSGKNGENETLENGRGGKGYLQDAREEGVRGHCCGKRGGCVCWDGEDITRERHIRGWPGKEGKLPAPTRNLEKKFWRRGRERVKRRPRHRRKDVWSEDHSKKGGRVRWEGQRGN